MITMFKIMKGIDKISEDELFNRVDSDWTRGHRLRVKKRRVKNVVRQGCFTMPGVGLMVRVVGLGS